MWSRDAQPASPWTGPVVGPVRLLAGYAARLWRRIAALCVLALGASALMAVQPVLIAAILATVLGQTVSTGTTTGPFNLNHLGAEVIGWLDLDGGTMRAVLVLGALYIVHAVLTAGVDFASALMALGIRAQCARLIQRDLLHHLLRLGLGFFHRERTGELLSRFSQDAFNAGQGLGPVVRVLVSSTGQIVVYGAYLVYTDPWLTAGAGVFVALHIGLSHALRLPLWRRTRAALDVMSDFSATLQETLTTIRVAKSFGSEQHEIDKVVARIDGLSRATMAEGTVRYLEPAARSLLDALAVIGILVLAVTRVHAGVLTSQGLLLYLFVGRQIIAPINAAASAYLFAQAMAAAFARVGELMDERPELPDGATVKTRFENRIELRDVSFAYGENRALDRVSLTIEKDEVVALVGPSGAGKSTLTDLMLRLYDPAEGAVLIDGVDVRRLRQTEYRRLFGVVPQETLLYHDTILNNIRYGRALSDDDVRAAARTAHADEFIRAFPEGYDTVVGDRGVRLSGGERQRIAIARAIAHEPQILILDEATSALDAESERQVKGALDTILKSSTAIVIAHRLSTVVRADKIVVLSEGAVVDIGRHDELLARCALYRNLCKLQFVDEPDALGART
jgi:subfamily B ATP-binding cassette protein MsbA